jgi:hypothetical protein
MCKRSVNDVDLMRFFALDLAYMVVIPLYYSALHT